MQKTSTFCFKRFCWILLCLIWTGFAGADVKAADLDIPQLELGKTYEYSAFQKVYAQYTAEKDGVLTLTNSSPYGTFLSQFESRYVSVAESVTLQTASNGVLTVNVEAGKTYYFYQFMMDSGSFVAQMDQAGATTIELESTSPEQGEALSILSDEGLSLTFSLNVKFDKVTLSCASASSEVEYNITSGKYVSISTTNTLSTWIENGTVQAGDEITITLENVRSADDESIKYGTNGTLTLTYKAPGKAVNLTNVEGASLDNVSEILSYYDVNNPAGKITLTFDGNLQNTPDDAPTCNLTFGDLETTSFYSEDLPVTINGNQLTIDLTGKIRRYEDMIPGIDLSTLDSQNIVIKLSNVKSEDGEFVKATQPGAIGSFSFSFNLKEINYSIASQFTPEGGILGNNTPMEIWIQNGKDIQFDGIKFEYTENNEVKSVVVKDFEKTADELNESDITISFTSPEINADKTSTITVSLDNLVVPDGIDHSKDITATYIKEFCILTSSIEDNAEMESVAKGTILTLTTNLDKEIGYFEYSVKDVTSNEIVKSRDIMEKTEEGWTAEFYTKLTLQEGHVYEVSFNAYASENDKNYGKDALGTAILTWKGTTPAFAFSKIKLLSISPEPDENGAEQITEAQDFPITLTFSGGVNLEAAIMEGYGMTSPLASCTSNEDKTVWTLVIGADYLYSAGETLSITANATDAATGQRVKGNMGIEDQSYWIFSYVCTVNVPEITIAPAEGGDVSKFTIGCENGISPSYSGSPITITKAGDESAEPAYTITSSNISLVIPEGSPLDYVPTEATFTLDNIEDGTYTINVPRGFFILGVDMVTYNNKTTQYTFTVKNGKGPRQEMIPVSTTPSTADVIYSLNTIKLNLSEAATVKEGAKASLVGRFGMPHEGAISVDPADESGKTLLITLDQEITDPGFYMLSIPAGSFGDADFVASETPCGNSNPALSYSFTISEVLEPIAVTPADGSQVDALSTFKFENVNGFDYMGQILLKNQEGETVSTITGEMMVPVMDENNPWGDPLYFTATLETAITEAGDYTLEIPEGFFYVGSNYDNAEAMTLTYHVTGKGTGVNDVIAEQNKKVTVYTLNGELIAKDSEPTILKTLQKGIYIVNGKKQIIK